MPDDDLHAILRGLLEDGRQLGITRGPESMVVARYAARIEPMFDELHGQISKLKSQLKAARKQAEAAEAAARQQAAAKRSERG